MSKHRSRRDFRSWAATETTAEIVARALAGGAGNWIGRKQPPQEADPSVDHGTAIPRLIVQGPNHNAPSVQEDPFMLGVCFSVSRKLLRTW